MDNPKPIPEHIYSAHYCSRCDGPGPRPLGTVCPECGCETPVVGGDGGE